MKRLDVVLLSLGLAALVATPAAAGNCRSVHRCAVPVRVVERVVAPVAVVDAVAVVPVVSAFLPAVVQAYGAAYVGTPFAQQVAQQPGYGSQPGAVPGYAGTGQSDAVLTAIQQLGQRLGAMEQRMGINPPAAQTPMPGADAPPASAQGQVPPQGQANVDVAKLFTTRCASCHQQGREGAGGGFVLTDRSGALIPLPAEKQLAVIRQVYSGKMPKTGAKLTDEELSIFVSWLAN